MRHAVLAGLLLCCTARASPGLLSAELAPADAAQWSVAAAADLRGWGTLQLHGLYRPADPLVPWSVGLELDLPVVLWAQGGGLDTLGLAARFSAVPLRRGPFELGADAALTCWVEASNLGPAGTLGVRLTAFPGFRLGPVFIALELGWEQPLFTALTPSRLITEAYGQRPAGAVGPPGTTAWAFPFTRFHTGVHLSVALTARVALFVGGAFIWTPSSAGVGPFDPMMFGFWPFTGSLGFVASW